MTHITSEDDFLALITAAFPNTHPSLALGRGDDCAELICPSHMAVSTDLFIEDAHFRTSYFTPAEIGHKALAVNISDLAAAGAKPLGASIGLTVTTPCDRHMAEELVRGMAAIASRYDLALTGGDLSRGPSLALCVTVWGAPCRDSADTTAQNADEPFFLRRGPVREDDILFAYGPLGLARAGLTLLEEQGRAAMSAYPAACAAHLTPEPQVDAGCALATVRGCRLMDISDGLARDLPRMLTAYGQNAGADITLAASSLHPEVVAFAHKQNTDPALFAFLGGEDYALLGACPASSYTQVEALLGASGSLLRLGRVTAEPGIRLNGTVFTTKGFDHFGA